LCPRFEGIQACLAFLHGAGRCTGRARFSEWGNEAMGQ
jgi:hypothetical protein